MNPLSAAAFSRSDRAARTWVEHSLSTGASLYPKKLGARRA
jgi:hypothetical protein